MISDGTTFVYAAYSITLAVLVVYTGTLMWKISRRRQEVAGMDLSTAHAEESHV